MRWEDLKGGRERKGMSHLLFGDVLGRMGGIERGVVSMLSTVVIVEGGMMFGVILGRGKVGTRRSNSCKYIGISIYYK